MQRNVESTSSDCILLCLLGNNGQKTVDRGGFINVNRLYLVRPYFLTPISTKSNNYYLHKRQEEGCLVGCRIYGVHSRAVPCFTRRACCSRVYTATCIFSDWRRSQDTLAPKAWLPQVLFDRKSHCKGDLWVWIWRLPSGRLFGRYQWWPTTSNESMVPTRSLKERD